MAGYFNPSNNNGVMRIGFDKDGVLSHFSPSYQRVIGEITGKYLFQPGDAENPPCWDWDLMRGYTKEERQRAFDHIARHPSFWYDCGPLPGVFDLKRSQLMESAHEIYFITNRQGLRVKHQSESWLIRWLELYSDIFPTVVVNGYRTKGLVAKALQLDAYIDDNSDNTADVILHAPNCDVRMLNASYNQSLPDPVEWAKKNLLTAGPYTEIEEAAAIEKAAHILDRVNAARVNSVEEFITQIGAWRVAAAAH